MIETGINTTICQHCGVTTYYPSPYELIALGRYTEFLSKYGFVCVEMGVMVFVGIQLYREFLSWFFMRKDLEYYRHIEELIRK